MKTLVTVLFTIFFLSGYAQKSLTAVYDGKIYAISSAYINGDLIHYATCDGKIVYESKGVNPSGVITMVMTNGINESMCPTDCQFSMNVDGVDSNGEEFKVNGYIHEIISKFPDAELTVQTLCPNDCNAEYPKL